MKIVLTGGPAAGKTTIAEVLGRTYCDSVAIVPEAASMLFKGGFPRSPDAESLHCQQLAIYHVQKQLEKAVGLQTGAEHLICDRGSLDGLAYWPGKKTDFFRAVNTTMEEELRRYDWVIHLDTASHFFYSSSSTRIEDHDQAIELNRSIKEAWSLHPKHLVITNSTDFDKKISKVHGVIHMILAGRSIREIRAAMNGGVAC